MSTELIRKRVDRRDSARRILTVAWKECHHIFYDFRTLFLVFLMPVVQLIIFGYALNLEIQHVDTAVLDYDRTPESRKWMELFRGSPFFRPFPFEGSESQIEKLFQSRKARLAVIVPEHFAKQLNGKTVLPVQFVVDASDANAAVMIQNYCRQIVLQFNERRGMHIPVPFDIRSAVLFNPNLKSSFFFVPGIMAMILIMISALLTSITIAREKETGTLEQLLVSPIRPREIIFGKVLPYIFLAVLDASLILLVGRIVFHVPFRGSALLLTALATLYIITALSIGLLISTRAKTQQVAMMTAITITLLPTFMLSGLVFPIASIPKLLQLVTCFVPARYFLLIVRGIMLKDSNFIQLAAPMVSLTVMALFLFGVSIRKMSTTLEK